MARASRLMPLTEALVLAFEDMGLLERSGNLYKLKDKSSTSLLTLLMEEDEASVTCVDNNDVERAKPFIARMCGGDYLNNGKQFSDAYKELSDLIVFPGHMKLSHKKKQWVEYEAINANVIWRHVVPTFARPDLSGSDKPAPHVPRSN